MAKIRLIKDLPRLPVRPENGHKGTFGRVLVVGGQYQMIGAPILAGASALRSGSGLVQVAMPREVLPHALSMFPELIGLALGEKFAAGELQMAIAASQVIVIGPGMGTGKAAQARVKQVIKTSKCAVIDADALNILSMGKRWPAGFKAYGVLTPHPGEMQRLMGLLKIQSELDTDARRLDVAVKVARATRQVIVLKGHRTVVTDGERAYVNQTGDSSLAKAGSGDVLAGVIGSLIGQKMDLLAAAVLGVWVHGRAGEIAGQMMSRRAVVARDVIQSLPAAFDEHEQSMKN